MSRLQIHKLLIWAFCLACAALHFAGCAYQGEVYLQCVGKGTIHLPVASGDVDCPPPGLELSVGKESPASTPEK